MNKEGFYLTGLLLLALTSTLFPISAVENYITQGPWLILSLLNLGLGLYLLFRKKETLTLPGRKSTIIVAILGLSFALSSLWNHSTFLEERWIQRYLLFFLSLQILQFAKDQKSYVTALRFSILPYAFFTCAEAFYQLFFVCRLGDPLERSCHAAHFGNINMLAQFLVLSLPLVFFLKRESSRRVSILTSLLIFLMTSMVLLTACRSSILALIGLSTLELIRPWAQPRQKTALLALLSGLTFLICAHFFPIDAGSQVMGETKGQSAHYRLAVWQKTFEMGLEHPMGVGVNNFEFGFFPYKQDSQLMVESREVDKSPHNEFLRIWAEDGWGPFALVMGLIAAYLFSQSFVFFRRPELSLGFRFLICLIPELVFQFPTDMWGPTLLVALLLPLLPELQARQIRFSMGAKLGLLISALLLPSLLWIRQVETLPSDVSDLYCRAFPDNWKMCGNYFKVHFESRNLQAASDTIAPVIRRQPFNFIALHFDFLLGNPEHAPVIACNYWNLFRGAASIPGSDVSRCERFQSRDQLIHALTDYARSR